MRVCSSFKGFFYFSPYSSNRLYSNILDSRSCTKIQLKWNAMTKILDLHGCIVIDTRVCLKINHISVYWKCIQRSLGFSLAVAYRGGLGVGGVQTHPQNSEGPPKSCQNSTRLWKRLKKLLNLGRQHPKTFGKKAVKFQTTVGSQLFYISNDK